MPRFSDYQIEIMKEKANTHSIKYFAQLFKASNQTVSKELRKYRTANPPYSRKTERPAKRRSSNFRFEDYGNNVLI